MKRIALFLACALLSMTLCSCAIEPISDVVPEMGHQSDYIYHLNSDQPDENDAPEVPVDNGPRVLCDTEDFTVTVTSMDNDEKRGVCYVTFEYENTSGINLAFYRAFVTVNGWQTEDYIFYEDVAPGETYTEELELHSYSINGEAITPVDMASFRLTVSDADDHWADPLLRENYVLYPSGLTEDQIEIIEREHVPGEQVLVDNKDLSFVIMDIDEEALFGPEIRCYIENKTDEFIDFSIYDMAVNRWAIDPAFFVTLTPGCRQYTNITLDPKITEMCGIERIDLLVFDLMVTSSFDFDSDYYVYDQFCVAPNGHSPDDIPLPERTPVDGEKIIVNDEKFTIILEPLTREGSSLFMNLFIENRMGADVAVALEDFRINGRYDASNYEYASIPVSSSIYYPVEVVAYSFPDISIEDVESLGCTLVIENYDPYYGIIFSKKVSTSF